MFYIALEIVKSFFPKSLKSFKLYVHKAVIVCEWACECRCSWSPEEGASSGMTGSSKLPYMALGTKLGYSGRAECDPNY